jgi:hypothetical protein
VDSQEQHEHIRSQNIWAHIVYFFPIQLLLLHLKKNHLLLAFWFLLFGYVSGTLASKYGVSYLFLYPEYLDSVGFWSHLLVGASLGGFVMAFNIYTYVIHAFRFRFLATLSRPFVKFSINNFLLPALFITYYLWKLISFQREIELLSSTDIFVNVLGFISGFAFFLGISLLYFYGTNKDVLGFLKPKDAVKDKGRFAEFYDRFVRERFKESQKSWNHRPWRVESYIRNPYSIALARDSEHYDEETLRKVFKQNHFNASLFEVLLVVTFLLVMNFGELPLFTIPGGASVLLAFTLLLMILSILLSWFRGWAVTIFIVLILVANAFSTDLSFLPQTNALYGLDYSGSKSPYTQENLVSLSSDKQAIAGDRLEMTAVLERWKAKQTKGEKPRMLIVNCSGGGLRSSLWVTSVLTKLDSLMEGKLMNHTVLMTGASGGMIGASYAREQYIKNDLQNIYSHASAMKANISKDILNPLLVSLASTDLFFQVGRFEYGGYEYPKDRAYRFEKQLLENTGYGLDRPLSAYREAERRADIPMIILYPTIINDGRKLLVSPLDMAFMSELPGVDDEAIKHQHEIVEFRKLLGESVADKTRFMSLIRASATFPYILPQVTVPTEPSIQLMDAGIRDNFGSTISYRFISAMREWIEENTSGVLILQLRDQNKDIIGKDNSQDLLSRLTSPLGNVYGNFLKSQDFVSDELFASTSAWLEVPLDLIDIQMAQPGEKNVSMSWHLTALEKETIAKSLENEENQRALSRVVDLIHTANR